MARVVLILVLIFLALMILRALRAFLERALGRLRAGRRPPPTEGDMARDPICGSWFDRRLAVAARLGSKTVEVCSETCRRRLEAG